MKINYLIPVLTIMTVSPKGSLLSVSKPAGAQAQGFQAAGSYDDDDWDIQ